MEDINFLSDAELASGIKKQSDRGDYLRELVNRHSGIYISMVNNYSPPATSSINSHKDDLLNDKDYYIYQAALKYDDSKNTKFSTYLGNETRWMCLNLYNKNKNSKEISDPNELYRSTYLGEDRFIVSINEEILQKIMSIAKKEPDTRVSKIFQLRYIDGERNKVMPWNKVCKFVDLSIQGCINVHNKAIKKIKEELNKDI
jgi:DNA-directed RNA polymerase specialized sigma subunit